MYFVQDFVLFEKNNFTAIVSDESRDKFWSALMRSYINNDITECNGMSLSNYQGNECLTNDHNKYQKSQRKDEYESGLNSTINY